MSVAPKAPCTHRVQRIKYPILLGTSLALGASILLAPTANAADKWGPGYLIPDGSGTPGASHLGAYGAPGQSIPGVNGLAYCADPELAGPEAAGQYGPAKEYSSWISASGKKASPEDVAGAAYVLSKYGQTSEDSQAGAVDAVVYSFLEAGTDYALPDGKRALERLSYSNVSPDAKKWAGGYMREAAMFAGPYKVNIKNPEPLRPGVKTPVSLDVTSASGHKVPGIAVEVNLSGAATGTVSVTTGADGVATTEITPAKDGLTVVKATAKSLPSSTLRAIAPANTKAQRMLLAGGTASATAEVRLDVESLKGGIKVLKTAGDTGKTLAGVAFEVKDAQGKTVTSGLTDSAGVWQVKDLAPGTYTVHEVKAVEGYQLAPDQSTAVTGGKTADVSVKDARIPVPEKPKPRPITIPVLPQTGA